MLKVRQARATYVASATVERALNDKLIRIFVIVIGKCLTGLALVKANRRH